MLVAPNVDYRASSTNAAEVAAVRDAFAEGILYGFPLVAESADGRLLVDATPFVVRDAFGVVQTLRGAGQGSFSRRCRAVGAVARVDAVVSEEHRDGGAPDVRERFARWNGALGRRRRAERDAARAPLVRRTAPLTGPGSYAPRRYDPRGGFFSVSFADYSAPLGSPVQQRLIVRHRLEKRDPSAAVSAPVEPIVYYLDNGTPEPVRSALLDGARWWNDAFEAAGFRDAFRVEVLPDTADAMDVRYNVIQWVHRSTRGWSYGSSVVDPRTGEILKGHVSLGSLRVRQDYLIAEGLLTPYTGAVPDAASDPMAAMALARIRQLAAHEVGHTLGLAHNFAASTRGRTSVMDYPAPLATLRADGSVSLDSAYAVGIGTWDRAAVRFGYGTPAAGQAEDAYLTAEVARDAPRGPRLPQRPRPQRRRRAAQRAVGQRRRRALRPAQRPRRAPRRPRPLLRGRPALGARRWRWSRRRSCRSTCATATPSRARRGCSAGNRTTIRSVGMGRMPARARSPRAEQREALALLLSALTPDALRLPDVVRRLAPRPPGFEPTRESVAVAHRHRLRRLRARRSRRRARRRRTRCARTAPPASPTQRATFPETAARAPGRSPTCYAEVTRTLWKAPMPLGPARRRADPPDGAGRVDRRPRRPRPRPRAAPAVRAVAARRGRAPRHVAHRTALAPSAPTAATTPPRSRAPSTARSRLRPPPCLAPRRRRPARRSAASRMAPPPATAPASPLVRAWTWTATRRDSPPARRLRCPRPSGRRRACARAAPTCRHAPRPRRSDAGRRSGHRLGA